MLTRSQVRACAAVLLAAPLLNAAALSAPAVWQTQPTLQPAEPTGYHTTQPATPSPAQPIAQPTAPTATQPTGHPAIQPTTQPATQLTVPPPPGPDDGAARRDFVAAMQRVRLRLPEVPDSPALEAYVLHDYLLAARLRRDLAASSGDELDVTVDAFVRAHVGQPVAHALRREWLASLAERKRWDWFMPRSADVTEPQLVCDRLAGRLATGDTAGLAQEALARWSMPQKQPDECRGVYAWLRTQGVLTADLAEARTRAALAADNVRLAKEFVADVPGERSAPLLQWIQLLEAPKASIAALAIDPTVPVEADALLAGFTRLGSGDADAASALLPSLLKRPDMVPALRNRLLRATALAAAYSRASTAVAAFDALPLADPNDVPVQEWRVRSALWGGDFAKALQWISAMPSALSLQPRWRYWRARAVAATSGSVAAAPLFAEIAGLRDYYGYLAADRLEQKYNLNIHPSRDDAESQAALAAEPGLIRAHALFDCDMADEAAAEWAAVLGTARPSLKVQAAHLASRWRWYTQTISTLAQAGEWDDVPLRYPRPYAAEVAAAGKELQVPEDWIFAIMRQESLFRKDAMSRADARGLMQMQPATASAVARRWHLPTPSRDALFDPPVAINLGTAYVRELLDKYPGQLPLSLAAYNAGPQAVARWLPGNAMDADIWAENIPYAETRGYVQHVVEHIVAYTVLRGAEPARLPVLLQITPAAAAH
ncbi:MAG: transglycosylase SLT domain-containing protein [Pseudomonadota bacterium]|nr:transglycosylase SLT domain-containing protein [Pseudomonadota bacterium]